MKMTWSWAAAITVAVGLLAGAGQAPAAQAASGSGWANAEQVPGLASHFKTTFWTAEINSLACASPGNCGAGGFYDGVRPGGYLLKDAQGFVLDQTNGRWGKALEVPGLAALNKGGGAQVNSVSCTRGECAAVGFYTDASGHRQGFVVTQMSGRWGRAGKVPGLAALNAGESAQVSSVSCASAGNCMAGGTFTDYRGNVQGFVVNQRSGRWRPALAVPGLTKLNVGGNVVVSSVRCASDGNCTAAGGYASPPPNPSYTPGVFEPFVVSEQNYVWSTAQEVPGIVAFNSGDDAMAESVSCPTAGNCSAGGYYYDNDYDGPFIHPWVVSEKNGRWGNAVDLGGSPLGLGSVTSVSCPSAGNCVAGGDSNGIDASNPAWVVSEANGRWGTPAGIAGTGALRGGIWSVSCPSVGNCGATGYYDSGLNRVPFITSETHGHWGKPELVPGLAALNKNGGAHVGPLSCPAGKCSAAGGFNGPHSTTRPFVVSEVK